MLHAAACRVAGSVPTAASSAAWAPGSVNGLWLAYAARSGMSLSVVSAPGAGSSDRLRDVRDDALVGPRDRVDLPHRTGRRRPPVLNQVSSATYAPMICGYRQSAAVTGTYASVCAGSCRRTTEPAGTTAPSYGTHVSIGPSPS